jgi:hypothetical protein
MKPKLLWTVTLFVSAASAQWVNYPAPGMPRTRDGKVDLFAKTPRTREGKPDLSGVWHPEPTTPEMLRKQFGPNAAAERDGVSVPGMTPDTVSPYGMNILFDFRPDDLPLKPEALEVMRARARGGTDTDRLGVCTPIGIPMANHLSEVTKIVETPGLILILVELDNAYRQIYTDGRKHPKEMTPSWFGYSVGKWEGDTLVVDTVGFNDKSRLDLIGHPHSEEMRMLERYRRRDFGHMDVETTIDDPKMYTKPFTIHVTHVLQADSDILEYFCLENEKDGAHIK